MNRIARIAPRARDHASAIDSRKTTTRGHQLVTEARQGRLRDLCVLWLMMKTWALWWLDQLGWSLPSKTVRHTN